MGQREWWRAESLQLEEKRIREAKDPSALDPRNDYGSYRMLLEGSGARTAQIASHNDVRPAGKVDAIARLLRISDPLNVLDAGCGAGFTTEALARRYPRAKVLGVDISADGIAFASKTHAKAVFSVMPVMPDGPPIGRFDLIFCFEFYPFTRHVDVVVHRAYIRYFADQLIPGGQLIVYQVWRNPESLSAVYSELVASLPALKFELHEIPHPKLPDILPSPLNRMVALFLERLTGKELMRKVLVITKCAQS